MVDYSFKKEKNVTNNSKREYFLKLYEENSPNFEKSSSPSKSPNANNFTENLSDEMREGQGKSAHPKIFTTTVIQRKKSISFKVIKNKEQDREQVLLPNEINNFEKINNNKNNFNNYFSERQGNSRLCDLTSKYESKYKLQPNNSFVPYYPFGEGSLMNKFTQIPQKPQPNEEKVETSLAINSGKQLKKGKKETYIDILIKAADRITQLGYYSIEHATGSNMSESSLLEDKIKPSESGESFFNENRNQPDVEHMSLSDHVRSSRSNSVSSTNNLNGINNTIPSNSNLSFPHKAKKKVFTKFCDNKSCQSHLLKKKVTIVKKRIGKGNVMRLCQFCIKAWNNKQYCFYCFSIYKDSNINSSGDGKSWIGCDTCSSWQHVNCEEKKGIYTNISKLIEDDDFQYFCPTCREKNIKTGKISKNPKEFLNKKRTNPKTQNFYRKEYEISFKYSKSKRIKEKLKLMEKEKKIEDSPVVKKAKKRSGEVESKKEYKYKTSKFGFLSTSKFNLDENENHREIIHDITKLKTKSSLFN